jgi:hypothetical protein
MLTTFQKIQGAKTCRIANYNDETEDPLVVAWLELMMALYPKGELIDGNSDEEANSI